MQIIHPERLYVFGKEHANARKSLLTWEHTVRLANWKMKQDVLKDFPRAKMIKNNRARFEIVHNYYRLIAHINYELQYVEVRFIGTHNEYEKINPETI